MSLFSRKLVLLTTFLSLFFIPLVANPLVIIETSEGTIEIQLMPEVAPIACENMIQLAEQSYYDGIIFHRIVHNLLIQIGDPQGTGQGGISAWGEPFEDEFSPEVQFDQPGLLAMANAGPNTNSSQFFITINKAPWFNNKHAIFGKVVNGYSTVKKIENHANWGFLTLSYPKKEIIINRLYIKH